MQWETLKFSINLVECVREKEMRWNHSEITES